MTKKLFIISIPMQPIENLKLLHYKSEDTVSCETRFPGIAMIEKFICTDEKIDLVTVRTDDDGKNTKECYKLFKEELSMFGTEKSKQIEIKQEIILPHDENEDKEKETLKKLFDCFEKRCDIYMDITYGSKLTSIEMFSSLCYAEIVKECQIKSVIYGKYSFDDSGVGELFDASKLYHTVRFLESAAHMDRKCFINLIEQMLE